MPLSLCTYSKVFINQRIKFTYVEVSAGRRALSIFQATFGNNYLLKEHLGKFLLSTDGVILIYGIAQGIILYFFSTEFWNFVLLSSLNLQLKTRLSSYQHCPFCYILPFPPQGLAPVCFPKAIVSSSHSALAHLMKPYCSPLIRGEVLHWSWLQTV